MPLSKHKCCEQNIISVCGSLSNKNLKEDILGTHTITDKNEGGASDEGSELESGNGSNSFAAYSDSAMSLCNEAKFEPDYAMTLADEQPSTSSTKEELILMGGGHDPSPPDDGGFQAYQNIQEHLLEFGDRVDYACSEYGKGSTGDEELEDMISSNGVNQNVYVLSSGRWGVNQDAQPSTRKPTIDQEFEQYFSTLMLE